MNLEIADQIAHDWIHGRKIDALKVFRQHTTWGLFESRQWLEENEGLGEGNLYRTIVAHFCQSRQDQIDATQAEIERLTSHLEMLRGEQAQDPDAKILKGDFVTADGEGDAVETVMRGQATVTNIFDRNRG